MVLQRCDVFWAASKEPNGQVRRVSGQSLAEQLAQMIFSQGLKVQTVHLAQSPFEWLPRVLRIKSRRDRRATRNVVSRPRIQRTARARNWKYDLTIESHAPSDKHTYIYMHTRACAILRYNVLHRTAMLCCISSFLFTLLKLLSGFHSNLSFDTYLSHSLIQSSFVWSIKL